MEVHAKNKLGGQTIFASGYYLLPLYFNGAVPVLTAGRMEQ